MVRRKHVFVGRHRICCGGTLGAPWLIRRFALGVALSGVAPTATASEVAGSVGRSAVPPVRCSGTHHATGAGRTKAEVARSNRAGRMAQPSRFRKPEMPKSAPFVPRTLPPLPTERPMSRAQREQDAKAYWDSLTEAQEVWALRKMGYFKIGERR